MKTVALAGSKVLDLFTNYSTIMSHRHMFNLMFVGLLG